MNTHKISMHEIHVVTDCRNSSYCTWHTQSIGGELLEIGVVYPNDNENTTNIRCLYHGHGCERGATLCTIFRESAHQPPNVEEVNRDRANHILSQLHGFPKEESVESDRLGGSVGNLVAF